MRTTKSIILLFCLTVIFGSIRCHAAEWVVPTISQIEEVYRNEIKTLENNILLQKKQVSEDQNTSQEYKDDALKALQNDLGFMFFQTHCREKFTMNLLKKHNDGVLTKEQYLDSVKSFREEYSKFMNSFKIKREAQLKDLNNYKKSYGKEDMEEFKQFFRKYLTEDEIASFSKNIANNISSSNQQDAVKSNDPLERLKKLKSLLDQGLINQKDYDTQREMIIKSL